MQHFQCHMAIVQDESCSPDQLHNSACFAIQEQKNLTSCVLYHLHPHHIILRIAKHYNTSGQTLDLIYDNAAIETMLYIFKTNVLEETYAKFFKDRIQLSDNLYSIKHIFKEYTNNITKEFLTAAIKYLDIEQHQDIKKLIFDHPNCPKLYKIMI
jgi:hypothetical protein